MRSRCIHDSLYGIGTVPSRGLFTQCTRRCEEVCKVVAYVGPIVGHLVYTTGLTWGRASINMYLVDIRMY